MIEENISKNLKNKSIRIEFLRTSRIRSQTSTSLNVFYIKYFSGVRVNRSLVLYVCCRSLFVLFLLAIVLSVLLRYTDSDYPFGIFKLFLYHWN